MPDSSQDLHKKVLGRKGEKLAEEYLKSEGCKVLKKNYRTPFGEADLIVQDGDEVVFVEVKNPLLRRLRHSRGSGGAGETAPI